LFFARVSALVALPKIAVLEYWFCCYSTLRRWVYAKWGHAPRSSGFGGASAYFLQSFKNVF